MIVAEADAVLMAEGNTEALKRPGAEAPPGSESRARAQGFPRNLGDLAASPKRYPARGAG